MSTFYFSTKICWWGGICGLSLSRCLQIRFWYWALAICPRKPSVAGGSASSVFHLLNNFTLASSIFVKFSTRYNLQTNSSASWTLDVLRSPSPRYWSSLSTRRTRLMPFSWCGQKSRRWCHNRFRGWKFLSDSMYWKVPVLLLLRHAREALSIVSLPFYHWANALHTLGIFSVLGISSCVKSPTPGTTIILSPGAWAIRFVESWSASSCLLEGTAGQSFQFWGSGTVLSSTIFRHIFKLSLIGFCEYYFWWTCQCSDQMSHLSYWNISQKQVHVQQIHQLDRQMSLLQQASLLQQRML